jgi:predicted DNA-binding protein
MSQTRRRKSYNDSTLSIRLPAQVLEHFTKLSEAHFKTPSEMTRQLIVDYIKNTGILAVAQTPQIPQRNSNLPKSPALQMSAEEQAQYNADWDY